MKVHPLTVGPILGHTTATSARLWGRGEFEPNDSGGARRCFGIVEYRKKGSRARPQRRLFKLNPNFDMTGTHTVGELEPETVYLYRAGWFYAEVEPRQLDLDGEIDWRGIEEVAFTTGAAGADDERAFVLGSCRYLLRLFGGRFFDDRGDKAFLSILEQHEQDPLHFLLMVGDQIYADDLNRFGSDDELSEFNQRYRDAFRQPHIRRLMGRLPTYMVLDDHEIEDNWPHFASEKDWLVKYPAAIHSYLTYQACHSPLFSASPKTGRITGVPERFWYSFRDGCCDVFVLDVRTERFFDTDNEQEREIISPEQMNALLGWLADGSGRVKLVASSVPFFPDSLHKNEDKWSGFPAQRTRILDHIHEKKVRKVAFLSGDIHVSLSAELVSPDDPDFQVLSIISSAFFWPYPHPRRREFQMTGALAANGRIRYEVQDPSEFVRTDNFTRVQVTNDGITTRVFSRKGEELGGKSYQFR